jgi:hypothetical protein
MLTATALVASHLVVFALGLLPKRHRWMRAGSRATEREHGWTQDPNLRLRLPRRAWSLRNRQQPHPGLVERHITCTNERPPTPR